MPESILTTAAAAQPSAADVYALGREPGESARLQRQSEELRSDSAAPSGPTSTIRRPW